jgi:hypothetical protein
MLKTFILCGRPKSFFLIVQIRKISVRGVNLGILGVSIEDLISLLVHDDV